MLDKASQSEIKNLSEDFITRLPKEVQNLIDKASYEIYQRDAYTYALAIDCPNRKLALALEPYKNTLCETLSKIVSCPVEGLVIYCASKTGFCSRQCERFLGCVNACAKAYV